MISFIHLLYFYFLKLEGSHKENRKKKASHSDGSVSKRAKMMSNVSHAARKSK